MQTLKCSSRRKVLPGVLWFTREHPRTLLLVVLKRPPLFWEGGGTFRRWSLTRRSGPLWACLGVAPLSPTSSAPRFQTDELTYSCAKASLAMADSIRSNGKEKKCALP